VQIHARAAPNFEWSKNYSMSSNRRRHENAVPLLKIATVLAIIGFAIAGGLSYVWLKNQLHESGKKIIKLEREAAELNTQIEVVDSRIAVLSSTDALRKRYEADRGKLNGLMPISNDRIVYSSEVQLTGEREELQPVSNQRTTP
jgi:hypothetical protein